MRCSVAKFPHSKRGKMKIIFLVLVVALLFVEASLPPGWGGVISGLLALVITFSLTLADKRYWLGWLLAFCTSVVILYWTP